MTRHRAFFVTAVGKRVAKHSNIMEILLKRSQNDRADIVEILLKRCQNDRDDCKKHEKRYRSNLVASGVFTSGGWAPPVGTVMRSLFSVFCALG